MTDNYTRIVQENLDRFYRSLPLDPASRMGAKAEGDTFRLDAFGDPCRISPEGIKLDGTPAPPILGILISLYALHAGSDPLRTLPLRSYKEFPGSMPYAGAFVTHTEQILVAHATAIQASIDQILDRLSGEAAPGGVGGDFSFLVRPLPKIALCYIFYQADEEFPASATCLFSQNADVFLPIDGLADVGEYTSRKILSIIGATG